MEHSEMNGSPIQKDKVQGFPPMDHMRMYSMSTSTSCSPIGNPLYRPPEKVRKPVVSKARRCQRMDHNANRVRRNLEGGIPQRLSRAQGFKNDDSRGGVIAKTPGICSRNVRKAYVACSPGGTDYIITPGRHKISVTEFLLGVDKRHANEGCPAMRAMANYGEGMLRVWLQREKLIDPQVYLLSFKEGTPMEQFRQMAIQTIFQYAVNQGLHEKTVHLTCLNMSRLIYAKFIRSKQEALTHELFATLVAVSLRNAIKNDEAYDKSDIFRTDPDHIWKCSTYLSQVCRDRSVATLNKLEMDCLAILEDPANPPLAPDFLDRYLDVGDWPQYVADYRELASYLIGLALFANTTEYTILRGVTHSKLAAAALVLAIKVVNTDHSNTKYEFWPTRLVSYTNLTFDDLKPSIRGLAALLRNKPRWSSILEKYQYYGKWSTLEWN